MGTLRRSDILSALRSRVGADNLTKACGGEGCRVFMTDVPASRVVVDAHKALPAHGIDEGRCDRVLFVVVGKRNRVVAVPIELKSGAVDISKVANQLRQGVKFVDRVVAGAEPMCRPVLVHGNRIHPRELKTLNREKIRFRGQDLTIKTARCGRPKNLASALQLTDQTV